MSLSIGIVGLPNVGKSTLFNILTGDNNALSANYPFATIEPNTGIATVPDKRLEKLGEIYNPQKITPAIIKLIDIAGLVAGASKGEGLGNQFLANIRECDAIIHVVRAFEDRDIIHIDEQIDPKRDIEIINTELMLADLQSIETKIDKIAREAKADPKKNVIKSELEQLRDNLRKGTPVRRQKLVSSEIKQLSLLTAKKVIFVFNINEVDINNVDKLQFLSGLVSPDEAVFIAIKLEDELKSLSNQDAHELLDSYGIRHSGLEQLVTSAYRTLGLQSFLTAGKDEVRAWTIKTGSTAPQAAGVIHSDFERGFIAADVMDYDDLITYGNERKVREAGKIRTEGKDYIVQQNDIIHFKFNV
ncbi:MAG: redox-regulated ATPase YchF [Candidatus Nanosyncoccaceae bacterium]|jgi:GTP-binding protein YchF